MHFPIRSYFPRRQALLFLVAILVPCAVLVGLGLRTMEQERELGRQRIEEERQRRIDEIGQQLLSHLEKIKLEEVTNASVRTLGQARLHSDPAAAFVGTVAEGRLQLPWETNPAAEKFRVALSDASFAEGDPSR